MIPNVPFDSRVAINDSDKYEYHVLCYVICRLLWTCCIEVTPIMRHMMMMIMTVNG